MVLEKNLISIFLVYYNFDILKQIYVYNELLLAVEFFLWQKNVILAIGIIINDYLA